MLLQQQVAQPLSGVERTRTEGRCSWGWASTDEGCCLAHLEMYLLKEAAPTAGEYAWGNLADCNFERFSS